LQSSNECGNVDTAEALRGYVAALLQFRLSAQGTFDRFFTGQRKKYGYRLIVER
jgi:hypothetical protein